MESVVIKFISYSGAYPNRCSGVLVLLVNKKEYKFGIDYRTERWQDVKPAFERGERFPSFWSSGGCVTVDKDWNFTVEEGRWIINKEKLPEELQPFTRWIDEIFNDKVPHGCCGGCI